MQSAISPEDQSGPSAPKKRGRRDDDPPDPDATAMEIVAPVVFNPISYKDMLTGSTHLQPPGSIVDLDDDDIELLDDDVIIGLSKGVPTIDFSDRVQSLAIKSMELTLVVKILGRRISYNTLQNVIYSIWLSSHPIKLIDIENDFFLVKFSDRVLISKS
ncbi:hypothetical protein V6N12_054214 [Hibiscus sabdariffa]|uniref:DUF4283 domain-containing protein n=1 Tax=Hibiscus sabdariffa TaxID=183260 RepID=A0ABR2CZS5_9ROSI